MKCERSRMGRISAMIDEIAEDKKRDAGGKKADIGIELEVIK